MEIVYELYYDSEKKRNYYFDPAQNKSSWELPANAKIIDKRSEEEKALDNKKNIPPPKIEVKVIDQQQAEYSKLKELYPDYFEKLKKQEEEPVIKKKKTKEEPEQEEASESEEESEEEKKEDNEKKIQFRIFKKRKVEEHMKRPARKQISDIIKETAYQEGNYDYNIWYDKFLTDRRVEQEKAASLYKCDPELDTGYTRADLMEKATSYFCVYFARGCCAEGAKCRFYHRIPQPEDLVNEENSKDVFGRTRHATFKEDMSGIGTFNKECRTISACDLKVPESTSTPVRDTVKLLYDEFAKWGEIEDINFMPQKAQADIRYVHRFYAEFAKEAMQDQSLGGTDVLTIKWGLEDSDAKVTKQKDKDQEARFLGAVQKKKQNVETRELQIQAAAEAEKLKIEKMKKKQNKFYERKVKGGNIYNPAFYQEFQPKSQVTQEERAELQSERAKITENCAKLNEVLQRISYNYQDKPQLNNQSNN